MLELNDDEVVVFTSRATSPICHEFEITFARAEEYNRRFKHESILANIDGVQVIAVIYNVRTKMVRADVLELTFDLKSPEGNGFYGQTSGLVREGPYIDSIVTRLPKSGQYILGRRWNRVWYKRQKFPHFYQENHKLWKTIYWQFNDSKIEVHDYRLYWMDDEWQQNIDRQPRRIRRF